MTALSIHGLGYDAANPDHADWQVVGRGEAAMTLRRPEGPVVIDLAERLAARDGWRIGPDAAPLRLPNREVERFEEDPERWDGLS